MKKTVIITALTVVGAVSAQAITFNLSNVYTGATPGGSAPWITVNITDVATDTVNIAVTHNATSAVGQFVASLYLNLDPFISSATISNEVNANKRNGAITFANNGVNGAAGNQFDMGISFVTSNSGGGVNRLKPNETWSADLTATGLNAGNFTSLTNNGLPIGAHIQGIVGTIGSGHVTTVPEPGTVAALGLGALVLLRRRKSK